MAEPLYVEDWRDRVNYSEEGPKPAFLFEGANVKVIVGGLMPGAEIPEHPEALGIYHFLEGEGSMVVDGAEHAVSVGATVVAPNGSSRGIKASTRLAFLATRIA